MLKFQCYIIPTRFCLYQLSTLFKNRTLSFRLLFVRHIGLFFELSFFLYFGRTLIPECVYRPCDHLRLLVKTKKVNAKHYTNLDFVGLLSKPFLFTLEELIKDNICLLGWGTTSRSSRCQNGWGTTCRSSRCQNGWGTGPLPGP